MVKRKYQVGCFIYAMVVGYNTKAIAPGSEPKSWAEFWDLKKFPARRTLPDMATGMPPLEFALIADGVPMDKLYPLDIDRAFKSLSRIRSAVPKYWDTGALSSTMLAENEVAAAGALWSTQRRRGDRPGAPLGIQWNQNMLLVQAYGIPVGAKNAASARKFIDWSSHASRRRAAGSPSTRRSPSTSRSRYAATRRTLIDPATKTPWTRSKGFLQDITWWAANRVSR